MLTFGAEMTGYQRTLPRTKLLRQLPETPGPVRLPRRRRTPGAAPDRDPEGPADRDPSDEAAELEELKAALFQSVYRAGERLTGRPLTRRVVLAMIKRRAAAAGLPLSTCCHTFRATGITAYLSNGGTLEHAQQIAWKKDRGKETLKPRGAQNDEGRGLRPREDYPWFWGCPGDGGWTERTDFAGGRDFDGNRWNNLHYTNAVKRAARSQRMDEASA